MREREKALHMGSFQLQNSGSISVPVSLSQLNAESLSWKLTYRIWERQSLLYAILYSIPGMRLLTAIVYF